MRKGRYPRGFSKGGCFLLDGICGLKSVSCGLVNSSQMESARRVLVRFFRRRVQVVTRVYPDWSRTCKPQEVRMGKGKGSISHWDFRVERGRVLFELRGSNVSPSRALEAFRVAGSKLPVRTRVVFG